MIRPLSLLAALIAAIPPAAAQQPASGGVPPSLMFTQEERDILDQARQGIDGGLQENLHLGSVLYRDAGDWVVWLNNIAVSPGQPGLPNVRILEVGHDRVSLAIRRGKGEQEILLYPGQTFLPGTGQVVNGRR
ncbi:hypothetical protein [Telmatospirillum sp. J64-1]|uniref:hypothetical protein n=1 Tax=Telmatospirillum sp. J64-1 TaxID=2502183 RepID=UPI00115D7755|nr:hypothetical protein [Telmatospirillum sp. J64-1]